MNKFTIDAIIIGAGVAGLSCARKLHQNGLNVFVVEGGDAIGGRIRTDHWDGFLLDRGFQVLQTAYPEGRIALDYAGLNLKTFDPGVVIRKNNRFHTIADPRKMPKYIFSSLFASVGSVFDKLRVLFLSLKLDHQSLDSLFSEPDLPTSQYLKRMGFSESMIQGFFQPFFAGVSLDPEIGTSSQIFSYIFKMFASGEAAIPSGGMAAIPRQIALDLPSDRIGLKLRVDALVPKGVRLTDGRQINAETVVLATEANEVQRLLGAPQTIPYRSQKCLYFSADAPPFPHSMLILNGDNIGPIVNLAVPSQVVPEYAPSGKSLIAAIVIEPYGENDEALKNRVKNQLLDWFGSRANAWRHLKTYHIKRALPYQYPPMPDPRMVNPRIRENVFVCGEYGSVPSIQWALYSGRRTAEAIISEKAASK